MLNGFRVRLGFTDGTRKEIDLEPYLHGPIFESIRTDRSVFRSVRVDKRMGTLVWDNGADIDPDVLCYSLKPAWMEGDGLDQPVELTYSGNTNLAGGDIL
jgi:hypothetical protein